MTSGEGHNAWKKTPTRIYKVDWREAKELLLDLKIFYLHCHSHRTLSLVLFSFFFLKVSTLQNIEYTTDSGEFKNSESFQEFPICASPARS